MSKKFYITTPIYYVNARPHIGHTYTTIACDTIARRQRMLGADTYFLTGTDEHGQKIERAAQAAGKTPQQFTDEVSGEFRGLWDRMGIYLRRLHPHHVGAAQAAACRNCSARFATTATSTRAHTPASTASPTSFTWMSAGPGAPCPECGRPTETVSEENYFFKLSAFQDKLLKLYAEQPEFIRPETRRNEVISFVRSGLRDLSISRSTFSWGIPVPDDPKHVIYVWLDALANYITAIGYGSACGRAEAFEKYWPADVHMIGKEIVRFHCVYWPAFLMAAGLPLPKGIVAHGWLLFEESKMSKSRGNIVRTETILDVLGADALRYFLLREIVFGQDGSFSFDALVQRYNSDLANGLGNLASRTLTMITRYFKGEVPYPSHAAARNAGRRRDCRDGAQDDSRSSTRCSISISFRARWKPHGDWSPRWINTSSKTSLGLWARSRMKRAGRDWRRFFIPRGGAADCDCAGASGDSGGDGEDLDAAGAGRHQEVRSRRTEVGTAAAGHEAGQSAAGISARRQERDRKDAEDGRAGATVPRSTEAKNRRQPAPAAGLRHAAARQRTPTPRHCGWQRSPSMISPRSNCAWAR